MYNIIYHIFAIDFSLIVIFHIYIWNEILHYYCTINLYENVQDEYYKIHRLYRYFNCGRWYWMYEQNCLSRDFLRVLLPPPFPLY